MLVYHFSNPKVVPDEGLMKLNPKIKIYFGHSRKKLIS